MSEISLADRIAFPQYINREVFGDDQKDATLSHRFEDYKRIQTLMEKTEQIGKSLASWKSDSKNLGLSNEAVCDFDKNIQKMTLDEALRSVYSGVSRNISRLFKQIKSQTSISDLSYGTMDNDLGNIEGGMTNALATQFGWFEVGIRKLKEQVSQKAEALLKGISKTMINLTKLQLGLFEELLGKLGSELTQIGYNYHRFINDRFDVFSLKDGDSLALVPSEDVLKHVIKAGKDAGLGSSEKVAMFFSIYSPFLRNNHKPLVCPALKARMSENSSHSSKGNLAPEFIAYINCLFSKFIIPNIDTLLQNEASSRIKPV